MIRITRSKLKTYTSRKAMSDLSVPCIFRILRPPDGRPIIKETSLVAAFKEVNDIWAQANIGFNLIDVATVDEGSPLGMFQYIYQKVENPNKTSPSALLGYSTFWKLPQGGTTLKDFLFGITKPSQSRPIPHYPPYLSSQVLALATWLRA